MDCENTCKKKQSDQKGNIGLNYLLIVFVLQIIFMNLCYNWALSEKNIIIMCWILKNRKLSESWSTARCFFFYMKHWNMSKSKEGEGITVHSPRHMTTRREDNLQWAVIILLSWAPGCLSALTLTHEGTTELILAPGGLGTIKLAHCSPGHRCWLLVGWGIDSGSFCPMALALAPDAQGYWC